MKECATDAKKLDINLVARAVEATDRTPSKFLFFRDVYTRAQKHPAYRTGYTPDEQSAMFCGYLNAEDAWEDVRKEWSGKISKHREAMLSDVVRYHAEATLAAVANAAAAAKEQAEKQAMISRAEGRQTRDCVEREHGKTRRGIGQLFNGWWRRLFPGRGGISAAEAARVLGVATSTVTRIEKGQSSPPPGWPGLADRGKFIEWAENFGKAFYASRSHRQSVRASEHGELAIAKAEAETASSGAGMHGAYDFDDIDDTDSLFQGMLKDRLIDNQMDNLKELYRRFRRLQGIVAALTAGGTKEA